MKKMILQNPLQITEKGRDFLQNYDCVQNGLTTPDTVRELLETTKWEAEVWFDNIRQKLKSNNDHIPMFVVSLFDCSLCCKALVLYLFSIVSGVAAHLY
jgi:hypothetical protein